MGNVTVVAYGDEIQVYDAGDESADVVYTVAIGANLDAVKRTITAEEWLTARAKLGDVAITDHRTVYVWDLYVMVRGSWHLYKHSLVESEVNEAKAGHSLAFTLQPENENKTWKLQRINVRTNKPE